MRQVVYSMKAKKITKVYQIFKFSITRKTTHLFDRLIRKIKGTIFLVSKKNSKTIRRHHIFIENKNQPSILEFLKVTKTDEPYDAAAPIPSKESDQENT